MVAVGALLVLGAFPERAFALCQAGESAMACATRIAKANCASSSWPKTCQAKEYVKLLPAAVSWLAERAREAYNSAVDAARRAAGGVIARVMGEPNKTSDPRWTGEFCTKDAYFARAKYDAGNDGLANVGVVQPGVLYRGSQPFIDGQPGPGGKRGNGFDTLKKLGIRCRVLLRTTTRTDNLLDEGKELAKRGIRLFHFPIPSLSFGLPADSVLGHKIPDSARAAYTKAMTKARDQFMQVVTSGRNGPCYLSCQSGKDRTGTLIGWYRAVVQRWKPDKIFREQEDCKFDPKGYFPYYRRVFCTWYKEKFGADPTCDRVLAGSPG
jgi:hypothetical protein